MTQTCTETPIESLELAVEQLLTKLARLEQENLSLRAQLHARNQFSERLIAKQSRASQAIERLITSMEGSHHE